MSNSSNNNHKIGSNLPHARFLFLLLASYIVINSDIFIDHVLSNINGALGMNSPSTYGTVLQGLMFIVIFIGLDQLNKANII